MSGKPVLKSGLLTRFLATQLEYTAGTVTAERTAAGKGVLDTIPDMFERLFTGIDILMTPVSPVVGVRLDEAGPNDDFSDERARFTIGRMKFTAPVNLGGNPAMSVPLNWDPQSGMPIGTHFIAARGDDRLLYELDYELEEASPWKDRWAPHSLKYPMSAIPENGDR